MNRSTLADQHGLCRISVVVPVLNEVALLPGQLDYYETLIAQDPCLEVIVSDGGSSDGSRELVDARATVQRIESERGRGTQMNAGAKAATGDVLLFLHADCRLPDDGFDLIRRATCEFGHVGGAFRHRIDDPHWFLRWIELGSNVRGTLAHLFYGDQGIFCRRDAFEAIGGYPRVPIMEEFAFCRAMRALGPVVLLRSRITTSARRFQARGPIRQSLSNWLFVARYSIGASLDSLKREYPDVRD